MTAFKFNISLWVSILILIGVSYNISAAQQPNQNDTMLQYIYVLKLKPEIRHMTSPTERVKKTISAHFRRLKKLTETGTVILAGRTLNPDEKGFGIVILEVESEEKARNLMNSDPAVVEGIMTAELFPYRVALMRE